jgi:hypothetical protein
MPDFPPIISPVVKMEEPNQVIPIYKGIINLIHNNLKVAIDGSIDFRWFPMIGPQLNGTVLSGDIQSAFLTGHKTFDVQIHGLIFGQGKVTGFKQSTDSTPQIRMDILDEAVDGDKTIAVTEILFAIPNLRSFGGGETVSSGGGAWHKNRLVFEDEKYTFTIDKHIDHSILYDSLYSKSGYALLYYGKVVSKKGPLFYNEVKDAFFAFSVFLSFLNGRRCSPLFRQGRHDEQTVWTDYKGYPNSTFKYVLSWPQSHSVEGLPQLWPNFFYLWNYTDGEKDFILSVVHWYTEANGNSGMAEGSIIMIQAALELIYNWLVVERKRLIIGDDADRISAANKIRLLLSLLEIRADFFPDLYSDLKNIDSVQDAPDALVQIRNAVVHGQETKRKRLLEIPGETKAHALHLGIWYVEMALLKILDFNGLCKHRGAGDNKAIKGRVPWAI